MLGDRVGEIAIDNMNWKHANKMTRMLVENGYAVMTTIEENLIILNYQYASNYPTNDPDRNQMVFMTTDDYWDLRDKENKEMEDDGQ